MFNTIVCPGEYDIALKLYHRDHHTLIIAITRDLPQCLLLSVYALYFLTFLDNDERCFLRPRVTCFVFLINDITPSANNNIFSYSLHVRAKRHFSAIFIKPPPDLMSN